MFQNFNLVAPFYAILEKVAFGDALNQARSAFVQSVVNTKSALFANPTARIR